MRAYLNPTTSSHNTEHEIQDVGANCPNIGVAGAGHSSKNNDEEDC